MPSIPRCMSTQHPDNATVPFFATSSVLSGEDEIREAFYAYSHLGCDEQMWDAEGKEIDTYVVKKLLSFYPEYFHENVLGEDLRLTLRVPNPTVETTEAKVLLETLESIPRSYDAARLFYGRDVAPIFEVILPMTTSARCINRIYHYYADHIVGRQHTSFGDDDITIAEWIGQFRPEHVATSSRCWRTCRPCCARQISLRSISATKTSPTSGCSLARSDTAMNYGLVSAALSNKIALAGLGELSARTGVRLHPILGMGSAPFRGGLSPVTAERVGREYPSVVTFSIQSAFKFDYPADQVKSACDHLKERAIGVPTPVDVERALPIIERYSEAYRQRIVELAPHINRMAKYVPARRARKLHIGLFGYALGELGDVTLPRAISFTCSLYSLGLPPELIGFDALTDSDLALVHEVYPSFEAKISEALCFTDFDGPLMTDSLRNALDHAGFDYSANTGHLDLVRKMQQALRDEATTQLSELVAQAALIRRFLG